METFARTIFAVATNTMYPVRSKLAVLVAVVSVVLLANSGRVSAQTYDWSSLSETQLANFTATAQVSVAISGDIAVVGDMFGNSYKGEVKIFERVSAGNWNALATLTASDAAASDNFGRFVGIDAASGRVIVGNYPDAGSATAYIYEAAVPEPSTALLLCLGLMALATGRHVARGRQAWRPTRATVVSR